MKDERKISLCIPTWNRTNLLFESFLDVIDDERISEVVISDDASDLEIFKEVLSFTAHYPKIRLYRNLTNQDCYRNKMTAISLAKNDWCILLDSDNRISKEYIDTLYDFVYWDDIVIFTPSWAKPMFDFRAYAGLMIIQENVSEYIDKPMFETMLNAMNFFVNKNTYLSAFDDSIDPVTSDSIFISYNHLRNGGVIYCVPNLEYDHRVHDSSHYKTQNYRTPKGFHEQILNNLRNLK